MKHNYESPDLEQLNVEVEQGFEASKLWYENGGEGDFNYGYETEDTWS